MGAQEEISDTPSAAQVVQIPPNKTGIAVGCTVFFFIIASFSVLLCTVTIYLETNYGWSTATISVVFVGGSLLGICAFLSVKKINAYISERNILIMGLGLAALGMAI